MGHSCEHWSITQSSLEYILGLWCLLIMTGGRSFLKCERVTKFQFKKRQKELDHNYTGDGKHLLKLALGNIIVQNVKCVSDWFLKVPGWEYCDLFLYGVKTFTYMQLLTECGFLSQKDKWKKLKQNLPQLKYAFTRQLVLALCNHTTLLSLFHN